VSARPLRRPASRPCEPDRQRWHDATEDTFELIRKAGGEGYYSMLSGHDAVTGTFSSGYAAQHTSSVERRDRITLGQLKSLNPGEGLVIFKRTS
jgi:intracellular multiplication protein IcmO